MKPRLRRNLVIGGILIVMLAGFLWHLVSGLPSLEKIENPKTELATKVYSVDGEVLDQFSIKNRFRVSFDEIPKTAVDALLATEDKDFYDHWGVDAVRFIKAQVKNVLSLFKRREGASTITQQLARNLYLGHNDRNFFDTVTRKLREFITSIQLERSFTKNEIIEFYYNVVYLGRGTYGLSSAAHVYFGRTPAELNLNQIATLVALLKGPGYFDPITRPQRALDRRNVVLSQMEKYGYISEEEATKTKAEPLQVKSEEEITSTGIAPHFVEHIRQKLAQKAEEHGFDIYRDGLNVYTTLNARMQRHANRAVEEHLAEYQKMFTKLWSWKREPEALKSIIDNAVRTSVDYRKAPADKHDSVSAALRANAAWVDSMERLATQIEVGFVALDPKNGNILAMVGGANFRSFRYGLNHVTQIRRQVGSAFKPFVYTVAIDNGYPPCFELMNEPVILMQANGQRWAPENSDQSIGGKATIREGIKKSINLIAVRAIQEIAPVKEVIEYATRMGITAPLPAVPSLALGSADISPLEMTTAFGVYANHGVYVEPVSILRIEDKDGNVIEESAPERREVLSEATAFLMTSMLQGVVDEGTAARIRRFYHLPAAGKTGTTNEFADAWFVGFTPQMVAGVWVGFDNKTVHFTTWDGQGGHAAAPIWGRFMKYVYEDANLAMPLEYFEKPEAVFSVTICNDTKKEATEFCPQPYAEYFTEKTRPEKCDKHTSAHGRKEHEEGGTIGF